MSKPAILPSGWTLGRLPDLIGMGGFITDGDWVESKDQDPDGEVRLIQLADIGDGGFRDRSRRFLTLDSAHRLGCTHLKPGDLLVARMPDPLGRCCVFPELHRHCVTAVDVCIVRLGGSPVSNHWLMHAINSADVRASVSALQSGSTRKRISKSNLLTIELPVPPAAEQARIVDAIETQLTRLDAAVAALERVRANLKRYRASVLKAAVEGRLVPTEAEQARHEGRDYEPAAVLLQRILAERRRRWEEAELATMQAKGKTPKDDKWKAKYRGPVAPDTAGLPELPEGWCWASVGQLGESVTGTTPSTNTTRFYGGDLPFFKPTDLDAGYHVREARQHLTPAGAAESRVLPPHAVLVTCIGATIGKTGLARVRCATNQQINALIPVEPLRGTRFLFWTFTSPHGQDAVVSNASSTTLPILNKARFERLVLPLPPLTEQERIVTEIERLTSIEDETSVALTATENRCGRLRQSVLKWAFEGRLVDQDPNDEPASALLERIRAERGAVAASGKATAKRNRRKRKAA